VLAESHREAIAVRNKLMHDEAETREALVDLGPERGENASIEGKKGIGISLPIRFAQPIVCWHSAALTADDAALQAPLRAYRYRVSGSDGANRIGRGRLIEVDGIRTVLFLL
jgi:hypothetical protein